MKKNRAERGVRLLRNATGYQDTQASSDTSNNFTTITTDPAATLGTRNEWVSVRCNKDFYDVPKCDIVRVLLDCLVDLNLTKTVATLEAESTLTARSKLVSTFRAAILDGQWDVSLKVLDRLPLKAGVASNRVRYVILRQKYLELLESLDLEAALACLQKELAVICEQVKYYESNDSSFLLGSSLRKDLHELASLVLCTTVEELRERARWDGANGTSRQRLHVRASAFISLDAAVPPQRLRVLIAQAIAWSAKSLGNDGDGAPPSAKKKNKGTSRRSYTFASLLTDSDSEGSIDDDDDDDDVRSDDAEVEISTKKVPSSSSSSNGTSPAPSKRIKTKRRACKKNGTSNGNGHPGDVTRDRRSMDVEEDEENKEKADDVFDCLLYASLSGDHFDFSKKRKNVAMKSQEANDDRVCDAKTNGRARHGDSFGVHFRRRELIRIIMQSLGELGFERSKTSLREE
eukprot:g4587.t1